MANSYFLNRRLVRFPFLSSVSTHSKHTNVHAPVSLRFPVYVVANATLAGVPRIRQHNIIQNKTFDGSGPSIVVPRAHLPCHSCLWMWHVRRGCNLYTHTPSTPIHSHAHDASSYAWLAWLLGGQLDLPSTPCTERERQRKRMLARENYCSGGWEGWGRQQKKRQKVSRKLR